MDITTYVLCKRYVKDSLAGAGALEGKSAYEVAQDNGFTGTEQEWLLSLKGSTPNIGENGNWFIEGEDTGVLASPSLAGYATESYVLEQIALIDLQPYVLKEELKAAIDALEFPEVDLSPYATKEEVIAAIAAIEFPEIDLSPYATKDMIPSLIGYATEQFVLDEIAKLDLTQYVSKSDLPLGELATETFVIQKIAEAQLADKEVDLSAYYTIDQIDSKFATIEALTALAEKIEQSGEANVIEAIYVNGVALPVVDKIVELPAATAMAIGLVKVDDDTIIADEEGKISVNMIDFKRIYLAEGDELILNGGKAI